MQRAFIYKLKPTVKQQHKLSQHSGCARYIYNWGLDLKIKAYQQDKATLSYVDLAKQLTLLKKQSEVHWLNDVAAESLQQSLRNLDTGFKAFFKQHHGFPKFKSKHRSKNCCKYINSVHVDFDNWKVKIPKVGWVKFCENKPIDLSKYTLGTLTVTIDKCGTFWCSINVDFNESLPPKAKVEEHSTVGIDMGIKDFAILSNGSKVSNPKFLERYSRHLRRLQQCLSKKVKGSNNRDKARIRVAKCYRRITDCRIDFLHKLSSSLVREYDTICLDDLDVEGMMQNHHLARSIASASWGEFRRMLTYKCEWNGKNLLFIDRFDPSSKTCHCCEYVNKTLTLQDRQWTCPECGAVLDRDVNAALNIKSMALKAIG